MSQEQSAIKSPWLETTNVDFSYKCPSWLGRKALCFLNAGTQADEQAGCIHRCARVKGRSEGLVYPVTSHWTKAVWKVGNLNYLVNEWMAKGTSGGSDYM